MTPKAVPVPINQSVQGHFHLDNNGKFLGSHRSSRNANLRSFIRSSEPSLSEALSLQEHSKSIMQAFREQSVIPVEPKILRLVSFVKLSLVF